MRRVLWFTLTIALLIGTGMVTPVNAQPQICTFDDYVDTYYAGYEETPFRYVSPWIDDKVSVEVTKVTGNITRVEFYLGETKIGNVPLDGTPLNYAVPQDAPFDTLYRFKIIGDDFARVEVHVVYTGWCIYGNPGIQEPPNLVLILSETPLLDEPDGKSIGQVIRYCQTVFIAEISKNGGYGRVAGFGNGDHWIDMQDTYEVAEDYGQPGGQAILPQCAGL